MIEDTLMIYVIAALCVLVGALIGLLVGLWVLFSEKEGALQSVRRQYFGVYEELKAARRLQQEMAASHADMMGRLYDKFADKQGYVDLVGVLGDKFADVIHGFPGQVPVAMDNMPPDTRNPEMGDLGLDNTGGVQSQRRSWFPSVEDDPWMEPQDRPPEQDGETVAWEPIPNSVQATMPNGSSQEYVRTPSGPMRTDGQPLFRSGQSSEPPKPGVE